MIDSNIIIKHVSTDKKGLNLPSGFYPGYTFERIQEKRDKYNNLIEISLVGISNPKKDKRKKFVKSFTVINPDKIIPTKIELVLYPKDKLIKLSYNHCIKQNDNKIYECRRINGILTNWYPI